MSWHNRHSHFIANLEKGEFPFSRRFHTYADLDTKDSFNNGSLFPKSHHHLCPSLSWVIILVTQLVERREHTKKWPCFFKVWPERHMEVLYMFCKGGPVTWLLMLTFLVEQWNPLWRPSSHNCTPEREADFRSGQVSETGLWVTRDTCCH